MLVVDRWLRLAGRLAAVGDAVRAGRSAGRDRRAASPVIGVVVLVAMVLLVAATVGWAGLGFSEQLREPAPNIAESNGKLIADSGYSGQIIEIRHVAGDSVNVKNMEVAVTAETGDERKTARIVGLPLDYGSPTGNPIQPRNLKYGDESIIARSGGGYDHGVLHEDNRNVFDAGSAFAFRIKSTGSGITLNSGDTVTVRVIHTPSNSVIIKEELTAE